MATVWDRLPGDKFALLGNRVRSASATFPGERLDQRLPAAVIVCIGLGSKRPDGLRLRSQVMVDKVVTIPRAKIED